MVNKLRWNVLLLSPHSIVVSMTPEIYLSTYKLHADPSCSGSIQHHHHHYHPPHQTPARHHLTSIPKKQQTTPPQEGTRNDARTATSQPRTLGLLRRPMQNMPTLSSRTRPGAGRRLQRRGFVLAAGIGK